jgi:hypothetical protein
MPTLSALYVLIGRPCSIGDKIVIHRYSHPRDHNNATDTEYCSASGMNSTMTNSSLTNATDIVNCTDSSNSTETIRRFKPIKFDRDIELPGFEVRSLTREFQILQFFYCQNQVR